MTTKALDCLVELRQSLPEAARETIVAIAENTAQHEVELDLTSEEERLIEKSREDFKHGRSLTMEEFSVDIATLFEERRRKDRGARRRGHAV